MSNSKSLVRGINIIFITNIINLLINAITNFLLPKYISVDTYAAIKEYQMYASYSGLLHLGFAEGVYIKFGGIEYESIDREGLRKSVCSMFIFQIIIVTLLSIIFAFLGNIVLLFVTISALPMNMALLYKLTFQATGEFRKYGQIMNLTSILTLFFNLLLLFVFKIDNPYYYIGALVAVNFIIWIVLERHNPSYKHLANNISCDEIKSNIRTGFVLMIGNFSSIIQTTMDRLFVNHFFDTYEFACYSFAVSMENLANVVISPVTITMYNYFCKERAQTNYNLLLKYVLVFSSLVISSSYIVTIIINSFIPKYNDAKNIIVFLFATQFVYVIIKGVYLNLYKANNKQNRYFVKLIVTIVVGFIMNVLLYYLMHNKDAFAVATLISSIVWFALCAFDFPQIGMGTREYIYMIMILVIFLICGFFLSPVVGLGIFLIMDILFISCILKMNIITHIRKMMRIFMCR